MIRDLRFRIPGIDADEIERRWLRERTWLHDEEERELLFKLTSQRLRDLADEEQSARWFRRSVLAALSIGTAILIGVTEHGRGSFNGAPLDWIKLVVGATAIGGLGGVFAWAALLGVTEAFRRRWTAYHDRREWRREHRRGELQQSRDDELYAILRDTFAE